MSADGDAQTKKMLLSLSARVKTLEAAVAQLQEPDTGRATRGLAELTAKLPAYAEHLTQAEVKAREDAAGKD